MLMNWNLNLCLKYIKKYIHGGGYIPPAHATDFQYEHI